MNAFGEQLVFVHDDGERDARLYHGDVDWEPRRVSDANGVAQVEDLILDRDDRANLRACWVATRAAAPRARSGRPLSGVVAREQVRVLRQASAPSTRSSPSMPSPIRREGAGATHSRGIMSGALPAALARSQTTRMVQVV
jgi:hypothetical protein